MEIITHSDVAESLVAKGRSAFASGDVQQGFLYFDEALKLAPDKAELYYVQGLSLFEYGQKHSETKVFLAASRKFKMATLLSPQYFAAWQAWGCVLLKLGIHYDEHHYFQEAQKKLTRAIALLREEPAHAIADLHWKLGVTCMRLAEHSGEALDLHQAISAFHRASSAYSQLPAEFWRDYALACYQFALQINDEQVYVKAISCLQNALALAPSNAYNWRLFARIFQSLYFQTYDEEHFSKVNEAYAIVEKLQSDQADMWLDWAEFLCLYARRAAKDTMQVQSCIEKCQRAFYCDPENPRIEWIWTEALALLGGRAEKLDLLCEAQNRIVHALETRDHIPEMWYAYGAVLREFGNYFSDFEYYYQAIEKFQTGLSIDRTCHAHWHAIGALYVLLAELDGEPEDLKRSLRFFQKAIDLHPCTFYIAEYAISLSKLGEMTHEQQWLETAIAQFERALSLQKNALHAHPHWLFHYACSLDMLGDFHEEESFYTRAIEIFTHVLMVDPDFYEAHHRLGLSLSHLGELSNTLEYFHRALRHLHICAQIDREQDDILVDCAMVLINIGYHLNSSESAQIYRDAQQQLWTAIGLGNLQAYYHLACIYSLLDECDKAMSWLYQAAHCDVLPAIDDMLQDEWLDNLRATSGFVAFLSYLEQRGN